jgi:hypothetical protein
LRNLPVIILTLALIVAAGVLLQGVGNQFMFDSRAAIPENPLLQAVDGNLDSWRAAALSSDSGSLGRPVSMLTFALNQLGAEPGEAVPFRLTNILIHLASALVLFLFVQRLLLTSPLLNVSVAAAGWVAVLAAAFWVLQPLSVSTVLYVVQRMAQLATLFVLSGLCVYVHYRERWVDHRPPAGELIAAGLWLLLITLLAVFSKENGLLLLWALVVVEVCFYGGYVAGCRRPWLDHLALFVLFLPILAGLLLFSAAPELVLDAYDQRAFSLEQRLQSQARVLWQYVGWSLSPLGPGAGLHHDDFVLSSGWMQPATTLLAALAWVSVLLAALLGRRRWPVYAFTVLFFLVTQSMESSIFALEMVYEHRNYLPSAGLALGAAWLLYRLCERFASPYFAPLAISVLLALAFSTWSRASAWGDEALLARVNLVAHPQSVRSRYHYANSTLRLAEQTRAGERRDALLVEARTAYQRMAAMSPGSYAAAVSLIYIESALFQDRVAAARWFEALQGAVAGRVVQPEDLNALSLLVDCQLTGLCALDSTELLDLLETVRRKAGKDYYLQTLRGRVLASDPDSAGAAISAFEAAIAARPRYAPAYYQLAGLHNRSGRGGDAVEVLRRLSAADPRRVQLGPLRAALEFAGDD